MTENSHANLDQAKSSALQDPRMSAFLSGIETVADEHIVDTLIKERCPSYVSHWSWPVVRPLLYQVLGYRRARRMADEIAQLGTGSACFDYLADALGMDVRRFGQMDLPGDGRLVIVCNHPTGLADGAAIWAAMADIRRDIQIFANADACRVNAAFADVIIPVEWVLEKRTPGKTRETLRRASEAFKAEQCLIIFPSGRLAHKVDGQLTEKDWFATAVSLARKNQAPIVPVHVGASNSNLFYFLSRLSGELRDITLFHELMNKKGDRFDITFGPLIQPEALEGDAQKITDTLKAYIEHELPADADKSFKDHLLNRE